MVSCSRIVGTADPWLGAAGDGEESAMEEQCGAAVWPAGAAPVDGDPWARKELLRGLRLCNGVAMCREEARCGMG
jgi:hypothetical protein